METVEEAVADYEVITMLGRGTAGRALLVEPPPRLGLGEPCVLKVLDRPVGDEEFRRVVEALRVVAALRGERVVEIFEAGEHQRRLFIAERYHPGGSLDRAEPLDLHEALRAVADAARGVHAMHEAGIVHRQVTPGNILLVGTRARIGEPNLAPYLAPGMTQTGTGSLRLIAYLEPEVIWGEPAARETDVWSLGITLHVALTGRHTYPDLPEESTSLAFQHVLSTRPVVDSTIPAGARDIIERCLGSRRSERFASALDLAKSVERFLPADRHTSADSGLPDDARVVSFSRSDDAVLADREALPLQVVATAEEGEADTDVVVQGIRCARGHLNSPSALICSRCRVKLMANGGPLVEGVRPPLGVLTFDDGDTCVLARDVVIGREPEVDPAVATGQAMGVRLADETRTVSRAHASIHLVGWDIFLEDRGSSNGTFIRFGAQPWHRLETGERIALLAGASVRLGERELTFEQHGSL